MAKEVRGADVVWGYAAQILNIGAGLLLLPVILRYLQAEEVALWFVFITLGGFAQLLEFGFQPTIARNAAYVYSGAEHLSSEGVVPINSEGTINLQLLSDLISTSRRIYRIVSVAGAVVLLGAGTLYILTVLTPASHPGTVLIGWLCFALGYILNFYFGYINALLQGRGDIRLMMKVTVYSRGSLVLLGGLMTVAGFGLIGLGVASLMSCLIGRAVGAQYFFTANEKSRSRAHPPSAACPALLRLLWRNARRLGSVHLGAFLIQRGNILVGTSFLGLATAASYSLTATLMMALVNMGMVVCNINLPYMSALQLKRDMAKLRDVYAVSLASAIGVFAAGSAFLLLLGDPMLSILHAKTSLVATAPLLVMCVVYLLELHHSVAANYITTTNTVPFVGAAVFSGITITLLALSLVDRIGVWGLILSQGLVQLAYNNWKWPALSSRLLQSTPAASIIRGFTIIFPLKHG